MQILSRGTLDGTFAWEAILDEDTQNQDFFPGEFLCTPRNEGIGVRAIFLPGGR